jgi:hypothetical protein
MLFFGFVFPPFSAANLLVGLVTLDYPILPLIYMSTNNFSDIPWQNHMIFLPTVTKELLLVGLGLNCGHWVVSTNLGPLSARFIH